MVSVNNDINFEWLLTTSYYRVEIVLKSCLKKGKRKILRENLTIFTRPSLTYRDHKLKLKQLIKVLRLNIISKAEKNT